jgi:broad specificity phosphatase PhoE
MRLILVRHGETDHNRRKLTLGRADVPLNDRGIAQARAVAASFARPPAAIWSSPLARAQETARAISSATGVAFVVEPYLVEMDVGEAEHLSGGELRERHPQFLRAWLSGDAAGARMPGGETLREVQDRAWAAIERLGEADREREVVAVTHNFVIAATVCRALNLPLGDFRRFRHVLASRTVIDIRDSGSALISLNDTAHLQAAGLAGDPR